MSSILCMKCSKSFSSISTRNRHIRDIHDESLTSNSRITCPICGISYRSFNILNDHLLKTHDIECKSEEMSFDALADFKIWKEKMEKETKSFYALVKTAQSTLGKIQYYECHRSNCNKFESSCSVHAPKVSGSIKINGVCPSRIKAEFQSATGKISVTFTKTHVGHKEELRCQPLSETEKNFIIEQLKLGVTYERILKEARCVENQECSRLNLLTMKDIYYIAEKNNLGGKRNKSDFVAVDIKVQEWNEGGRENVFFYKKIGETHDILEKDDFVLAYMNEAMEYMLETYGQRLICADGTHGTNPYKFELTTYLVVDDQNLGYPVMFLITNRKDTLVQKIVIEKLKKIVGVIIPSYLMTDDSPIYYKAWTTVMGKIPHRLICTWHIKKNWVTHTRSKITNKELRAKVEKYLNILLKETDKEEFFKLKNDLLKYLEDTHETMFLNYLNSYYFQSNERIATWAHCYRHQAGINTNMYLESFHRTLKYKYFGGKTVQRLEACLDALDKLIREKSWQRMGGILRPTATHHDLLVNKTHKIATEMSIKNIAEKDNDTYLVHSQTKDDFYEVTVNNKSCSCRTLKCPICEFCIHRFSCTCYESTVKNHFCKHIHLVGLYIKEKTYPTGPTTIDDVPNDLMLQNDIPTAVLKEELDLRISEAIPKQIPEDARKKQCHAVLSTVLDHCKSDHDYNEVIKNLLQLKGRFAEANLPTKTTNRKRNIEKQTFFPNKKNRY